MIKVLVINYEVENALFNRDCRCLHSLFLLPSRFSSPWPVNYVRLNISDKWYRTMSLSIIAKFLKSAVISLIKNPEILFLLHSSKRVFLIKNSILFFQ